MSNLVWVYAVTTRADRDELRYLNGVGGERVRDISEAGLHAVVGSLGATALGGSLLTSLFADPSTMYAIGSAHHEVIAAVARDNPVVPMRLATVYPDDETVRALLARHWQELTDLLRAFSGTQEWGVQVHLDAAGLADAAAAEAGPGPLARAGLAPAGPESAWQQAEAGAARIDHQLGSLSIETRRHPLPCLRFTAKGWMVLKSSYLVRAERVAEFRETACSPAARQAGLRTTVTGPWPPYSFVDHQEAQAC